MRAPSAIPAFAAALVALLAARASFADVAWREGALEPALVEARTAQRFVLVDFSAVWCGPCQTMDALVWNRADVATAAAQGYVALRVDADTAVGTALRQRYNVGALPTVLAVRADGTEIDRLTGESDAATVVAALGAWRRGQSTLDVLAARLVQRPADLALRLEVGSRYADRGDEASAISNLDQVIAADAQNARGFAAQAMLALGDRLYLRTRHDAAHAITRLQQLVTQYPSTSAGAHAYIPLATALHQAGRDPDALATLDAYLAVATPDTIGSRSNSAAWMMFREHWDLPRAERYARAGYARAPRDHALIDTLAELVFAQGRASDAIELESQATRIDPSNGYYRRQIERFRANAPPVPQSVAAPAAAATAPRATASRGRHTTPSRRRVAQESRP